MQTATIMRSLFLFCLIEGGISAQPVAIDHITDKYQVTNNKLKQIVRDISWVKLSEDGEFLRIEVNGQKEVEGSKLKSDILDIGRQRVLILMEAVDSGFINVGAHLEKVEAIFDRKLKIEDKANAEIIIPLIPDFVFIVDQDNEITFNVGWRLVLKLNGKKEIESMSIIPPNLRQLQGTDPFGKE